MSKNLTIDELLRKIGLTPKSVGAMTAANRPAPAAPAERRSPDELTRAVLAVAVKGREFRTTDIPGLDAKQRQCTCGRLARRGDLRCIRSGTGGRGPCVPAIYEITAAGRRLAEKLSVAASR